MTDKPTPLNDIKSMTDEERKQFVEERAIAYAAQKIDELLAYIKANHEFGIGELFCKKVVEAFNSTDAGGFPDLLTRLKDSRNGKSSGPRTTWNKSRYLGLLIRYEVLCKLHGREKTLRLIGESEGIGVKGEQDFNPKKVAEKITEARKLVTKAELDSYLTDCIKEALFKSDDIE